MRVRCPHCQQKYDLDDALLGQELGCQQCGGIMCFEAPTESQLPTTPVASAAKRSSGSKRRKMRVSTAGKGKRQPVVASPPKKRKGIAVLVLAALVAAAGGGFYAYQQLGSQEPSTTTVAANQNNDALSKDAPDGAAEDAMAHNRALFADKVKPFFDQHCISCHGPDKEKGSLRVDLLVADLNDHYSLDHLQNIIDELTTQNMPPEDEPQPDPEEVVEVMNVLTEILNAAKGTGNAGGGKPVRRLTRREFINTVWDQLGVHVSEEGLPEDLVTGAFDTNAENLYMTDMHVKAYLEKSRSIVKRFIASRDLRPGVREVPVKYSPELRKSLFSFVAHDLPPAGHLIIKSKWWKRESSEQYETSIGSNTSHMGLEFEITGTADSPQEIEFPVYQPAKSIRFNIKHTTAPSKGVKNKGKYRLDAKTLIRAQETFRLHPVILGEIRNFHQISHQPFQFFSPFRKYGENLSDAHADAIIKKFVRKIKRGRPVNQDYLDKLAVIYRNGRKMGLSSWQALEEPLAFSMCSMDFMYHFENRSPSKKQRRISGIELANRLSYVLWRSSPDNELLRLGESGELLDTQVKAMQVQRMMKDDKFGRFLNDFTIQWLELQRQDLIVVNPMLFKSFNFASKGAMKRETIEFVSHMVRENLPLENLIDSDFLLVNNTLGRHYGIPGIRGNEFRVVGKERYPGGHVRGGILTHAGILMQGGTGDRSSIVERGAFIARKIINRPPAPPPPNAGELPVSDLGTAEMTGAELVRHHASAPQCANCHEKIDPLGMGLEEFDAIGRFRSLETRINPRLHLLGHRARRDPNHAFVKFPIEPKGHLYDGQTFTGVEEMKKVLMTQKNSLAKTFVCAFISYSNGRKSNFYDEVITEKIAEKYASNNYPIRSIIEYVVCSELMTSY